MIEEVSGATSEELRPGRDFRGERYVELSRSEIEAVAHHGASHAVVAYLLYGQEVVRDLRLCDADGVISGRVSTFSLLPIPITCRPAGGGPRRGNPAPVTPEAILDAHGVQGYAGVAGEFILARSGVGAERSEFELTPGECERISADREALAALASRLRLSRPAEHFYQEYWNEATRLLESHWVGVRSLAKELCRRGFLHGSRIDTLLSELLVLSPT
jgi:hypothetical protein